MSDNEQRKREFIRKWRALLKAKSLYALKKLDEFGEVTLEDLATASTHAKNPHSIHHWALGMGYPVDYEPGADQFVQRGENYN